MRKREIKYEIRPWGVYFVHVLNEPIENNSFLTVKTIFVKEGEETSLQYHKHRSEFWQFLAKSAAVNGGRREKTFNPGECVFIPVGHVHRLKGQSTELHGSLIQEFSCSDSPHSENDIVRIKDKYGRVKS